ncbi:MAG: tryptophan synthase subunit alpha [Oscillospiraceae bacterium]|nr:tryptophan synthase subunit alpha [Oscillospiraceae bacterium]
MPNRIDQKFEELKSQNKKALITYIAAGDGGYDLTEQAVLAMEKNGADIVEIGVPFSDPIAEGPVIQAASLRAIRDYHTTLKGVFELVKKLRTQTDMPLLLMLYANTIFRTGTDYFFEKCREVGIDGVIVPDLPFEEHDEFQDAAERNQIYNISLVTPASTGRIAKIASQAQGFLYCVSSVGVTGMRDNFDTDFDAFFSEIANASNIPYCVGFGIRDGKTAHRMSTYCDGVIVGSAIVNKIGEHGQQAVPEIAALCQELRAGLDQA